MSIKYRIGLPVLLVKVITNMIWGFPVRFIRVKTFLQFCLKTEFVLSDFEILFFLVMLKPRTNHIILDTKKLDFFIIFIHGFY